jgi:hypothetical protein
MQALMVKIDYILLAKHFRGETSEMENNNIVFWRDESLVNASTYDRLKKVNNQEVATEERVITKEEKIIWKKIITKILAEEDSSVNS